ncbi:MAG: TetR family transcriptional regulator, partial [Chloroflexi bacterium]|nr:TetR family transcriptional regulator [Chloroflexota bacterium]
RDYPAINISEIAAAAGLAKGTVYLYFRTKEELFLAVLEQQLGAWLDVVNAGLAPFAGPDPISGVADLLSRTLDQQPALIRLLAITHVILEQNIDLDTALQFKHFLLDRLWQTGILLETCLTFLDQGEGIRVLLRCYALLLGVQQLAHPSPAAAQALEADLRLAVFKIDFAREFSAGISALLHGAKVQSEERT